MWYSMRQKNGSKIVPFRSIKRYLPCRLYPVFSGNIVRFSCRYRSISFRFVPFPFRSWAFTMELERASHFSERGLRPLSEMALRGSCLLPGGCQSIQTWLRGGRLSKRSGFPRRTRAPLDSAQYSAEFTER